MKKQIRLMSAALAACTLLSAGGAPAFAADSGQEHNYTILREITDDTDFMWFPDMQSTPPTLEDLFLRYYGKQGETHAAQ